MTTNICSQAQQAKSASQHLALLSAEAKNEILIAIAGALKKYKKEILAANLKDIRQAQKKGLNPGLIDRLSLNQDRVDSIIREVLKTAELKDYVGEIIESRELPDDMQIERVRVPLGVIGIIYEARPNVTVDAACLCLKSGNAVILKGGSDAINSNRSLVKIMNDALAPFDQFNLKKPISRAIQFIDSTDRKITEEFLRLKGLIDVIIPRGGKGLIDFVRENATVPIIETGASVVHTYVDESANVKKAVQVVINSKLRRVSICNTLDSLLLHKEIAEKFLKEFVKELVKQKENLEIRADEKTFKILKHITLSLSKGNMLRQAQHDTPAIKKASLADYDTEFLAPILAVKIVKDIDEAIEHISKHSLKHSEAILTENREHAEKFLKEVDAACVYWNASTQFSDGAQYGLGSEIGISTQKLHARGPFALEGLTSYKWVVKGNYNTRPL